MSFPRKITELCPPALLYFIISFVSLAMLLLQNLGNSDHYSVGSFSRNVPSTTIVFVVEMVYVLFWTWVLNLICKDGHSEISWLLILLPWILMFVLIGLLMIKL